MDLRHINYARILLFHSANHQPQSKFLVFVAVVGMLKILRHNHGRNKTARTQPGAIHSFLRYVVVQNQPTTDGRGVVQSANFFRNIFRKGEKGVIPAIFFQHYARGDVARSVFRQVAPKPQGADDFAVLCFGDVKGQFARFALFDYIIFVIHHALMVFIAVFVAHAIYCGGGILWLESPEFDVNLIAVVVF